jgi:hypothetical protein
VSEMKRGSIRNPDDAPEAPRLENLGLGMTGPSVLDLIGKMRARGPMTAAEKDAQARSFIRGQTGATDEQIHSTLGPPLAELLAAERAAGRLAGLREAAAWHALKAAHYERQVHDTFGKGEFHADAARSILALAEGGEG